MFESIQFEIEFRNSRNQVIGGIWFRRGGWRISTDHQLAFNTKEDAVDAWNHLFDHETGMRIRRPQFSLWR